MDKKTTIIHEQFDAKQKSKNISFTLLTIS